MLFFMFLALIVLGIIFRKSKIIFLLQLTLIIFFFFNTKDCADYDIYYTKYYYVEQGYIE